MRRDDAVVAFDTELFGHFWHEGVTFLEALLEHADVVPLEPDGGQAAPDAPPTSWGEARDLRTWSACELAWDQRRAELTALGADPPPRALRELLALQSSDWAFLITRGSAGDYPRERAQAHLEAFAAALAGQEDDAVRNLAPQLAKLGLRAALRLKRCNRSADFSAGDRVQCIAVIRAESAAVDPERSGGTVGALVRLPGRIAVMTTA